MEQQQILRSQLELGEYPPNLATMLHQNAERFGDKIAFQEKVVGEYEGISWTDLYRNVRNIAANLADLGFEKGDKMVLFSRNRREMLETELAVMAYGGIAVPIFANFKQATAELLITNSKAKYIALSGDRQLAELSPELSVELIFAFNDYDDNRLENVRPFRELYKDNPNAENILDRDLPPDTICLNMFTSGTMNIPKCVQLMHKNILSQQAAIKKLWQIDENDRFLSYLPWHHSFGGIFEKYAALYNGATLSLESGYGKDPKMIFKNWDLVRPTVFFSIPKVYQTLVDQTRSDKTAEEMFFHSGLKFIFTAAAPLPQRLSDEFEQRGIPVLEGWGLTETSPCCTVTDPSVKREPGVVGFPIPGIEIRMGQDNELEVRGPNVMNSYFDNEEANAAVFTEDGWFRTGDVGEITPHGVKLIVRKDRIFKLSNGEKVIPTDIEKIITQKCKYVSYAYVSGSGENFPVALLFPDKAMIENSSYDLTPLDGCFCPKTVGELSKCLQGCMNDANCAVGQKFAKIKAAAIVDEELNVEDGTLTTSMKMSPGKVSQKYKIHLRNLYGADISVDEDIYVINMENMHGGL